MSVETLLTSISRRCHGEQGFYRRQLPLPCSRMLKQQETNECMLMMAVLPSARYSLRSIVKQTLILGLSFVRSFC